MGNFLETYYRDRRIEVNSLVLNNLKEVLATLVPSPRGNAVLLLGFEGRIMELLTDWINSCYSTSRLFVWAGPFHSVYDDWIRGYRRSDPARIVRVREMYGILDNIVNRVRNEGYYRINLAVSLFTDVAFNERVCETIFRSIMRDSGTLLLPLGPKELRYWQHYTRSDRVLDLEAGLDLRSIWPLQTSIEYQAQQIAQYGESGNVEVVEGLN